MLLRQDQTIFALNSNFARLAMAFAVVAFLAVPLRADFQGSTHVTPFDEPAIGYNKAQADDPITQLQERVNQQQLELQLSAENGYLNDLLKNLDISKSSQVLVFSKTSLQRERISPRTPRALFFNDDVYLGYIPGSPILEISTADPKLGGVFYTLDQVKQSTPQFKRVDQCLECHASGKSMGVPGHILRSFVTDESGVVELASGISEVNHRTPIEQRWGGWYVTGTHGDQSHLGNLIGHTAFEKNASHPNYLGNITNLSSFFDISNYPTSSSDIVALMVLEHQTHMHNFITRLHYESTIQASRYGHINYVTNIAEAFLKYLLFVEEAPIKSRIQGDSSFAKDFESRGPFDGKGRSLRQFDLETRLFKYPCSYLIYSKTFDALPDAMKAHIYQRLYDILTNKDASEEFDTLSRRMRRDILEILQETKKDLPGYWHAQAQ